jgi:cell division protein FtsN
MQGGVGGSRPDHQRGSVALGVMLGVVLGLAIAVAVAVFVTRAPLPFVNKVVRSGDRVAEPRTPAEAPDPNRPPSSRARASGDAAPAGRAAEQAPSTASEPGSQPTERASGGASLGAPAQEGGEAGERTLYVLQAGAFRLADDADSMKAKLALIGLEARVSPAEVNGQRLFRVRIGPYAQIDDLNRARARLEENGIESTVVRSR